MVTHSARFGAGTVRVEHTIIRLTGVGLLRKSTKTAAGERTLTLPAFAVSMLQRRKIASRGQGPVFPPNFGRADAVRSRHVELAGREGVSTVAMAALPIEPLVVARPVRRGVR